MFVYCCSRRLGQAWLDRQVRAVQWQMGALAGPLERREQAIKVGSCLAGTGLAVLNPAADSHKSPQLYIKHFAWYILPDRWSGTS